MGKKAANFLSRIKSLKATLPRFVRDLKLRIWSGKMKENPHDVARRFHNNQDLVASAHTLSQLCRFGENIKHQEYPVALKRNLVTGYVKRVAELTAGAGEPEREAKAALRILLGTDEIAEHYVKQLKGFGWPNKLEWPKAKA